MSAKPNDGGPIAPNMIMRVAPDGRQNMIAVGGLSLRDWLAGLAMQGYLAGRNHPNSEPGFYTSNRVAAACVQYADDLIEALAASDGREGA